MNWQSVVSEIQTLSKKINYKPEIIIGITRGGIVPARLLSAHLQVKTLHCISILKITEKRKIVSEILDDLTNKNILLVEDMLESGKSLEVVKKYLESKGAIVKTACLYTMPITKVNPDFSLKQVNKVQNFPWE